MQNETEETETFELDRAMLTDEIFWEMVMRPWGRVPYLVR
jgi:hypothetical protein